MLFNRDIAYVCMNDQLRVYVCMFVCICMCVYLNTYACVFMFLILYYSTSDIEIINFK